MKISSSAAVMMRNVALGIVLISLLGQCYGYDQEATHLREGYYNGRCTNGSNGFFADFFGLRGESVDVERFVADIVRKRFKFDKTIAPVLLRMQFHDCFVRGCDASVLLDGEDSENTAPPNESFKKFGLINDIKTELEKQCFGVVSCADIIAMATRDAFFFASSEDPNLKYPLEKYKVQTGRKDGRKSFASEVDLPSSRASASDAIAVFAKKRLNQEDLTYLLGGGHSVGVTHCGVIQDRLSNSDNTMNKTLKQGLINYCDNPNKPISLDQGTPNTVDTSLYREVYHDRAGILRADQELASNAETRPIVEKILKGSEEEFKANFWRAMVKLQAIGVLDEKRGEVRSVCNAVN